MFVSLKDRFFRTYGKQIRPAIRINLAIMTENRKKLPKLFVPIGDFKRYSNIERKQKRDSLPFSWEAITTKFYSF